MRTRYTTTYAGDEYQLTADFAQAASPVDGDALCRQVADFRHRPSVAMRTLLEDVTRIGGDDPDDYRDEIDAAVASMSAVEVFP